MAVIVSRTCNSTSASLIETVLRPIATLEDTAVRMKRQTTSNVKADKEAWVLSFDPKRSLVFEIAMLLEEEIVTICPLIR